MENLIDGKAIAGKVKDEVAARINLGKAFRKTHLGTFRRLFLSSSRMALAISIRIRGDGPRRARRCGF